MTSAIFIIKLVSWLKLFTTPAVIPNTDFYVSYSPAGILAVLSVVTLLPCNASLFAMLSFILFIAFDTRYKSDATVPLVILLGLPHSQC